MAKFITKTICMALMVALCAGSLHAQGLLKKDASAGLVETGFSSVTLQLGGSDSHETTLEATETMTRPESRGVDLELSYSSGTVNSFYGFNLDVGVHYISGCISFTAGQMSNYAGGTLHSIEVAMPGAYYVGDDLTSFRIWIKHTLDGPVVYEETVTPTLAQFNLFELAVPYDITDTPLVIGLTAGFNLSAPGALYPLAYEEAWQPGAFWACSSSDVDGHSTGALFEENYDGALLIFGHVDGDPLPTNDLTATGIMSPYLKWKGSPETFIMTVYNGGTAPQINFTVQLLDANDNVVDSRLVDNYLLAGKSAYVYLTHAPATSGDVIFKGKVIQAGDENPANDVSDDIPLRVYSVRPMAYCYHAPLLGYGASIGGFPHQGAIQYDAADMNLYAGKQLAAVEVAFTVPPEALSACKIWIRSALDGEDLYSQAFTPVGGWNTVTFDTPYPLTSAGIFIGYEVTSSLPFPMGLMLNNPISYKGSYAQVGDLGLNPWHYVFDGFYYYHNAIIGVVEGGEPITISTLVSPFGAGLTTGAGNYEPGDPVTVTATANTGNTFVNWTENSTIVSPNASYSFDAATDRVLKANFMFGDCTSATDLNVSYNSDCEAELTWTAPAAGDFSYNIYRDNTFVTTVSTTSYTDYGFDIYTGHTWKVTVVCGDDESEGVFQELGFCTTLPEIPCDDFIARDDSQNPYQYANNQFPINTTVGYSYTQTIYQASDINSEPGQITAIGFRYINETPQTKNAQSIFLANLDQAPNNQWVPHGSLTEVFSGTIDFNNSEDWVTIQLDTPFDYEGGIIVMAVHNNSGSVVTGSENTFRTSYNNPGGLHYYSNTPFTLNPAPPERWNSQLIVIAKFTICFNDCEPVTDLSVNYTPDCEAVISWTASATAIAYNILRDNVPIASNVTATTYTDEGFVTTTSHTWTVIAVCGNGESEEVSITVGYCESPTNPDCDPPTNLAVEYNYNCNAVLTWDAPVGAGNPVVAPATYAEAYVLDHNEQGYFSLNLATGLKMPVSYNYSSNPWPTGEDYDGNDMYRLHENGLILRVNPDGTTIEIGKIPGCINSIGLAYDWITNDGTWYFYDIPQPTSGFPMPTAWYPELYKLNMNTLTKTLVRVCTENHFLRGLAMADDGFLYAISMTSSVTVKFEPVTGQLTVVGGLGFTPTAAQDLAFDRVTNMLYASPMEAGTYVCKLGTISKSTGYFTQLINYGYGPQHPTLSIAKRLPTDVLYNIYRDGILVKENSPNNYYLDIDCDALSAHTWEVRAVCANGESAGVSQTRSFCNDPETPCEESIVDSHYSSSSPANSGYTIPINTSANYSYSQQVYTASEIGIAPGQITAIAFNYIYGTSQDNKENQSVYIGNTNLTAPNGWIPASGLTLVYSGTLDWNNSEPWFTIQLDTPFDYEGGNLVVAVLNNSGTSNTGTNPTFMQHPAMGIASTCTSTTPIDINNPPSAGSLWARSHIKFIFCEPPPPPPCDESIIDSHYSSSSPANAGYAIPINTNANYSYSQQVYLANEIGVETGQITAIAFNYVNSTSQNNKENQSIYIGHTTQTMATSWTPNSELTLVYNGTLDWNNSEEWFNIQLDTPFDYEGGNLLIAVLNNSGTSNTSTNPTFMQHPAGGMVGATSYGTSTTPIDVNALPARSSHYYRNHIKFTICELPPSEPCNPVTDLQVAYNSDCEASLTWTAPSTGNFSYNIYRDDVFVTTVTATSYADYGFDVSEGHTWKVTVVCGDEESEEVSVTMEPLTIGVPVATAATDKSCDSFVANWNAVDGAEGYLLTVYAGNTYILEDFATGNVTSYPLEDLVPGTTYHYYVKAIIPCHSGEASNEITVTPFTYTIAATAGTGGSITPNGTVLVTCGADQTFILKASKGYQIADVVVDGESVGAVTSYTFTDVNADHTIVVYFEEATDLYTVFVTYGTGGTVSPNGLVYVVPGTDQIFIITPLPGYKINQVLINDVNDEDAVATGLYIFTGAGELKNHTLTATFTYVGITQYYIDASVATAGGTISPLGKVMVNEGTDQTFYINAQATYQIKEVLVNGINNLDAVANGFYTFENVQANHVIVAKFEKATYIIEASVSTDGGTISPIGTTVVTYGGSQAYTITPQTGYLIDKVLIDNENDEKAVSSGKYTFSKVEAPHSIVASFKQRTFDITSSAGGGGEIDPEGVTAVGYGNNITYVITPSEGYMIKSVLVDGKNNTAAVASGFYTFANVTTKHTIAATFAVGKMASATDDAGTEITVYPNPTTGLLTICDMRYATSDNRTSDNRISEIKLFDVMGRMVMPVETLRATSLQSQIANRKSDIGQSEIEINISHLPTGVYFLRIKTETGVVVRKVVKQ